MSSPPYTPSPEEMKWILAGYSSGVVVRLEAVLNPDDAMLCRHKVMMRPSMEACEIDVFRKLQRCRYNLKALTSRKDKIMAFGLLLPD